MKPDVLNGIFRLAIAIALLNIPLRSYGSLGALFGQGALSQLVEGVSILTVVVVCVYLFATGISRLYKARSAGR